jgi:hypothetical protein
MGARCRFLRDRTTAIVPKAFARNQACRLRFIDPRIDEIRKAFKEFPAQSGLSVRRLP